MNSVRPQESALPVVPDNQLNRMPYIVRFVPDEDQAAESWARC
jgi:hypothetical protein